MIPIPEMIPKELSMAKKKTLDCGLLRATEVIFACVLLKLIYGADIMKTKNRGIPLFVLNIVYKHF